MSKFLKVLITIIFMTVIFIILMTGVRGLPGNPTETDLQSPTWTDNGPFELSPERGRFALTYSLIENKSFTFSLPIARFAAPDVGYFNSQYVSLFAPAISYLIAPGYLIGKILGYSQVGASLVIAVFAFINFLLIRLIAKFLGANSLASNLAGIAYLFTTPGFAYAVSIYQHQISTFLVLASLLLLLKSKSVWSTLLIWMLCAAAIPIDYPNLFFLFPIGLYSLSRLIAIKLATSNIVINLNFKYLLAIVGILPPLLFFLWFNKASYGSPLQFSGTVTQVKEIGANNLPIETNQGTATSSSALALAGSEKRSAIRFFKTRATLNGLYTLWLSRDRGVIFFTPVILLGFIGFYYLYKSKHELTTVFLGVIAGNVAIYSMWGDVYGGWAFGSRYLIPTYAVLAIGLSIALTKLRKNLFFTVLFLGLFIYSAGIGVIGALTSNRNPPKVEILGLEALTGREEKYSWDRNWQFLTEGQGTKSVIYNTLLKKYLSPISYFQIIFFGIISIAIIHLFLLRFKKS